MNIFLDTNFLIDYFIREDYSEICERFMNSASNDGHKLLVSFLSIANFAYIMRKLPKEQKELMIQKLCQIFKVVPNNSSQIERALKNNAADFEDALQYQSAVDGKCKVIITQNQKDYPFATIPVMSAEEYIKQYCHNL